MRHPRPTREHPIPRIAAGLCAGLAVTASLLGVGSPAAADRATPAHQPAAAAPFAAAARVTAVDTQPPRVHSVSFSRTRVKVSGLRVVPVRVAVHLSDPSGVQEVGGGLDTLPRMILGPTPGFRSRTYPALERTSGTARNGVWSATVHVPSTWNGTVRVMSVSVADRAGNVLPHWSPGAKGPKLRVTGTHRPALTFHYSLLKSGGFRLHGRAYFTDTGRPIANRRMTASVEQGCLVDGAVAKNIRTDSRGYYEKVFRTPDKKVVGCVVLTGPTAPRQTPTIIAYRSGSSPR